MDKLLISACLVGENCRYDGKNCFNPLIEKLKAKYELILICPEYMGGLPIPRAPSERRDGMVMSSKGVDVSVEYEIGAKLSLFLARENNVVGAVLKEKSPSCGTHFIYDGTFSHVLIEGMGVTAELLHQHHIPVYSEDQIEELL